MSRICIEIGNDIARRIIDQLVMPNLSTSVYQLGYDVESKAYLMASYPLTSSREYRHSIEEWIIYQWRIHEILIK